MFELALYRAAALADENRAVFELGLLVRSVVGLALIAVFKSAGFPATLLGHTPVRPRSKFAGVSGHLRFCRLLASIALLTVLKYWDTGLYRHPLGVPMY